MKIVNQNNFVFEYNADVVICGAGTAGAVAAIAAARQGAQVLMIEQFGMPGGSATLGLVTPLMHTGVPGCPHSSAISREINDLLWASEGTYADGRAFDPMGLTRAYEKLLDHPNITILYHTMITDVALKDDGSGIEALVLSGKPGRGLARGKVFIDATGDADVCYLSGAEMLHGDDETHINQPVSLRYIVSGIDIKAFYAFVRSEEQRCIATYEDFKGAEFLGETYNPGKQVFHTAVTNNSPTAPLYDLFAQGMKDGELTEDDTVYWQVFGLPGRTDSLAFNNPEFFDIPDATAVDSATKVQIRGRAAIYRQMDFYRKHFPGFENAYISNIAPMVGIRESRRAVTDYTLTAEDVATHRKFEDHICGNNYGVDVHGKKSIVNNHAGTAETAQQPWYEISYRNLQVKGFDNLMVAGRCIGADFIAQSSLRIQIICRALGEAAGIGAALACAQGITPREIDGSCVRSIMKENGAQFPEDMV